MRLVFLFLVMGCIVGHGPGPNELVAKVGRKETWRARIEKATFCSTCGRDAPVTIDWRRVVLTIPLCYAHAQSKVGDHDNIKIERDDHVLASEGELDIADCTSKHVVGTLRAEFPDGQRIAVEIDTELREP